MTQRLIRSETLLTSHQVGSLLQVNPTSVNNWIRDGRIPAFRTPGGHRRIRAADLIAFLTQHEMPIPAALRPAMRRRLIMVDDDPLQLRGWSRILKPYRDRVDVELFDNGIDALVRIGSWRPQVVVLDVMMPGVDGIEVCRRLKAQEETREITIITTSGQLTPVLEQLALDAGASRVLPKPTDPEVVLKTLGVSLQTALHDA